MADSPLSPRVMRDLKRVEEELERAVFLDEGELCEASLTTLRGGGKRLRPALVLVSGQVGSHGLESLIPAAVAVELIHMASLIHDDIVDGADFRRGLPTVSSTKGLCVATAAGDFLFATAFVLLSGLRSGGIEAVRIMAEAANILSLGQIRQMEMAHRTDQNMEDYLQMIWSKTAILFAASCRLGGLISGVGEEEIDSLGRYGDNLGMAFQIYDDVLDITGTEESLGKPVGIDLRDGTVTMPILFALEETRFKRELCAAIESPNLTEEEMCRGMEIILNTRALERSKEEAKKYMERAIDSVRLLSKPEVREELVSIGKFVIDRYH